ncbi:tetratricopeptide repeat protein [Aequorivita capsosiphonis]|uniref:tetratricopeptide repeat protein n=1 Tax=Aequorivita capsosiphonis TaxID=487317 RepID=UPI000409112B|nr:tetratricopeptide repeat protein [Aequorivita capsosiphonis]
MKKAIILLALFISFKAGAQSASASSVLQNADSLYEIGDYSNAIKHYKKVTMDAAIATKIAKAYVAIGNIPKALHYYEQAISETNPPGKERKGDIQLQFEYAKLLGQSLKYQKADNIFKNLTNEFPSNPNFIYQRALLKEAQNDSTAIEAYREVYRLDTNHINAAYKIARNYIENRRFLDAEIYINKGLAVDSSSVRFLTLRGLKQFHTKDCPAAIATYQRLSALGESNIQIHENLAFCYSYTNQFEKALEEYKILLNKFDDKNPKWHLEVAKVYRSLKEYEEAQRHINIAIALQEIPLSDMYLEMASIYNWKQDYKKEMEALKAAFRNNPLNEMALYKLAVAADNYFADKKTVLLYYQNYLKQFSENGRMRNLAKQRVSDLKKELHFATD